MYQRFLYAITMRHSSQIVEQDYLDKPKRGMDCTYGDRTFFYLFDFDRPD